MSKASRRKRAGRKPKHDVAREPNGRESRSASADKMHKYVMEARARKSAISGRDDLPADVLGIMLGHQAISEEAYQEGRALERVMMRLYGSATGSGSAMFREAVSPQSDEDAVSVAEPMSDEAATALFEKMDRTLRNLGLETRDLVIGAVRYTRFPVNREQVGMIITGLEALAKHRKPVDGERREMVCEAA